MLYIVWSSMVFLQRVKLWPVCSCLWRIIPSQPSSALPWTAQQHHSSGTAEHDVAVVSDRSQHVYWHVPWQRPTGERVVDVDRQRRHRVKHDKRRRQAEALLRISRSAKAVREDSHRPTGPIGHAWQVRRRVKSSPLMIVWLDHQVSKYGLSTI